MDETARLTLIAEAIKYCQRVRAMGMPPSSYTKALREPIHFLWERRNGGGKDKCATFRSAATIGVTRKKGLVVYDHAVPFRYLQEELLALTDVTPDAVRDILERHCVVVLVTKEEDNRLHQEGLRQQMPGSWDKIDPFARYSASGIDLVPND